MAARPVPPLRVHQPAVAFRLRGELTAHKFCVAGINLAVIDEDGSVTFTVSVPVVLPEGIVRAEQVTPGNVPQVMATALAKPPVGVSVIVEVPEASVPAAEGVVATVAAVPPTVNEPVPEFEVKLKLNTVFPPKAIGLGSAMPNELTMMK